MCGEIIHEDIILTLIKKITQSNQYNTNGHEYNKKALQKSLYFFNQDISSTFSFIWGHYGPFSYEIHCILNDLIHSNYISETRIPNSKGVSHNLAYIKKDDAYFEIPELPEDLNSSLDRIIKFVSDKSSRELELLASVHFWAKYQQSESNNYAIDFIFENIDALKPSTGFTKLDIQDAIKTLEEEKYLIPESPDLAATLPLQSS